ncbi:HAD hydrolase-like protein, partial [Staphylococcus arlettae]|uniref:HAD hydrolase-like protein n=3 Tax=Staphylococcus TaxID=1279 RepID=UPI000D4C4A28
SNNSACRIERFNKNINIAFIDEANKPNKNGYIKAIERLEVEKSEILLIGDQIFTDILGANLTKIDSVLVKYLLYENEVKIGKKRRVEKAILWIFFLTKCFFKKNSKIEKLKVNYNEKA